MVNSEKEAPQERSIEVMGKDVLSPLMTTAQMNLVLNKTPDYAIKLRPGPGGTYKYVKHGYVTDTLNKVFGFDWDLVLVPMSDGKMYTLETEEVNVYGPKKVILETRTVRHLAVCGYIEARVRDEKGTLKGTIKKSGFGSQLWLPSQELGDALKGAKSDLLKVCAMAIGVALDLYWNDSAEMEAFEKRQDEAAGVIDSKFVEKTVPETFVDLLSMSMSKYQMDGAKVSEVLGKRIDELMTLNTVDIAIMWEKIVSEGSKK